MGDDVPILGALGTLLKADGLLLFLMLFLYIMYMQTDNTDTWSREEVLNLLGGKSINK